MEVDKALSLVGGKRSLWQLQKATIMTVFVYLTCPFFAYLNVFVGWTPPHHCTTPNNTSSNQTIPYIYNKESVRTLDQCHVYVTSSIDNRTRLTNQTTGCHDYTYNADGYTSIVTEFDLVCDKSYLSALSQSCYFFGVLCGSLIFPTISDMFGRKLTALGALWCAGLTCLCTLTVRDAYGYIAIRFFSGAFIKGSGLAQFTLNAELFPSDKRSFAASYQFFWYSIWLSVLSLVGYLLTDWRHVILLVGCSCYLSIIAVWLLEESVPWLVANGRGKQAVAILEKAAKRNRATLPSNVIDDVIMAASRDANQPEDGQKRRLAGLKNITAVLKLKCACTKQGDADIGVLDILKHPKLRIWSLLMLFVWMNTNIVYYGLSFSSTAFVGNRFVNFFLTAVVEIPAYIFLKFSIEKFGRRYCVLSCYILTGLFVLISNCSPRHVNGMNLVPVVMAMNAMGKFFVTTAYGAIYIYTSELYPTNIRTRGIGMNSMFARFGSMLAPFAEVLARKSAVYLGVTLGVAAVVNGILVLPLPETKKQPLPETMDDIDYLSRRTISCKCSRPTEDDVTGHEVTGDDVTREKRENDDNAAETTMMLRQI
ncbi:organic cation transporter protein-like [Tubulanus polymorphus]|uniref:organic cation transporter protein-like n=1 Tax=Tubulanus polymorphus TaxID=672921 RepID=UPI003DA1FE23